MVHFASISFIIYLPYHPAYLQPQCRVVSKNPSLACDPGPSFLEANPIDLHRIGYFWLVAVTLLR